MTDMQIAMRLTMADGASAPLGSVLSIMEKLKAVSESAATSFNTAQKAMRSLGTSARTADKNVADLGNSLGTLGEKAIASNAPLNTLAEKLVDLAQGVIAMETTIRDAVSALGNLGASARSAGTGVAAGTKKLEAANVATKEMTESVGGLNGMLKSMAETWAALKIDQGLKASIESAATMQNLMARMQGAGYSRDEAEYARDWSERYAQQFKFASSNDIMAGRLAVMQATGQNNELSINQAMPQLLKNAFAISQTTHESTEQILQNMLGIAEARGLSQTSGGITQASNLATQIVQASLGRMGLQQQETVLRQTKYGGAALASDQGIANLMAFAEQYLTAGGGGGGRGVSQAGTTLSMWLKTMMGGKMNKNTIALLQQMGMFEGGGGEGDTTTTSSNTTRILKGSTEGERDPIGWLMEVLAPAMTAYVQKHPKQYGKTDSEEGLQKALDRLVIQLFGPTGGVNVANLAFLAANPGSSARINEQRNRIQSAHTGDKAIADYQDTYQANVQAFDKQLKDLEVSFGQNLLPIITKVMKVVTDFIGLINDLAQAFPNLTSVVGVAATALAGFLAVKGFVDMTGNIKLLTTAIKAMGTASTEAAAKSEGAAAATEASWASKAGGIIGTLTKIGGVFVVTFSLGYAVRNVEIAGEGIQHYIEQLVLSIMGAFDKMWTSIYQSTAGFLEKLGNIEEKTFRAMGMDKMANDMHEKVGAISASAAQQQKNFTSRDDTRLAMFTYEGTDKAKGDDYLRQAFQALGILPDDLRDPNSAPNSAEEQAKHLKNNADDDSNNMPGGLISPGGGVSESEFQRVQRMIREQMDQVEGNPFGAVMQKYQHYADILRKGGDSTTANQAMQVGTQEANKAGYEYENQKLEQLKQEYEVQKQLNAAKREAGEITKEQEQQANSSAASRLAPQLQTVAKAGAGYARAMGNRSEAESMETQGLLASQMPSALAKQANQAGFEAAMQEIEKIRRTVQAFEQANQEKYKGGQISHDQMVNANNATEKQFQPQMEAAADAAERYALSLRDPELSAQLQAQVAAIQQMGQQLTTAGQQALQLAQNIESSVGNAFSNLFSSMMKGNQTWRSMGANLNNALLGGLNKNVSNYLGQQVEQGLFGDTSKGNGSLGGSGGLLGLLGQLFHMGGGSAATDAGAAASSSGMLSGIGGWLSSLMSFDVGTDSVPHDMVAQIHAGERIIPAATNKTLTDQLSSGGLGGGHQINMSITAMDSQSVLGAMDGVKRELAMMLDNTRYSYNMGSRGP